jgi:hypothetical protein
MWYNCFLEELVDNWSTVDITAPFKSDAMIFRAKL